MGECVCVCVCVREREVLVKYWNKIDRKVESNHGSRLAEQIVITT